MMDGRYITEKNVLDEKTLFSNLSVRGQYCTLILAHTLLTQCCWVICFLIFHFSQQKEKYCEHKSHGSVSSESYWDVTGLMCQTL